MLNLYPNQLRLSERDLDLLRQLDDLGERSRRRQRQEEQMRIQEEQMRIHEEHSRISIGDL